MLARVLVNSPMPSLVPRPSSPAGDRVSELLGRARGRHAGRPYCADHHPADHSAARPGRGLHPAWQGRAARPRPHATDSRRWSGGHRYYRRHHLSPGVCPRDLQPRRCRKGGPWPGSADRSHVVSRRACVSGGRGHLGRTIAAAGDASVAVCSTLTACGLAMAIMCSSGTPFFIWGEQFAEIFAKEPSPTTQLTGELLKIVAISCPSPCCK